VLFNSRDESGFVVLYFTALVNEVLMLIIIMVGK
jgi:hypothetical protein